MSNIYNEIGLQLGEFLKMKESIPLETIPIQKRQMQQVREVQNVDFMKLRDQHREEAIKKYMGEIANNSSKSHIQDKSYQVFLEGILQKIVKLLDGKVDDIDSEVSYDQAFDCFCEAGYADAQSEKHKIIVFKLCQVAADIIGNLKVQSLLTLITAISVLPHQTSENEQIVQFNKENIQLIEKLREMKFDVEQLLTHRLTSKIVKPQVAKSSLEMQQIECKPPNVKPNNDLVLARQRKLEQELEEYGIHVSADSFHARVEAYEHLKAAKLEQKRREAEAKEVEGMQLKPKLSKFDPLLYQQPNKLQLFTTEKSSTNVNQKPDPTYKPKIVAPFDPKVFEPKQMPMGYDKIVERLKQGRKERQDTEDQIKTMGCFDPKKYEQFQRPLTKQEISVRERFDQNIKITRKTPLKVESIQVTKTRKATVKFYPGDTVEDHADALVELFKLNNDQKSEVTKQLQHAFGNLTTTAILQKRSLEKSSRLAEREQNESESRSPPQEHKNMMESAPVAVIVSRITQQKGLNDEQVDDPFYL